MAVGVVFTHKHEHEHEHELGFSCNSMVLNFELNPIHHGLLAPSIDRTKGLEPLSITLKPLKIYMATKTNENNALVIYNIDIITCFKHFPHTLTNKETRAKTLKEFKRCLIKFDTDKMHFEPILATTKNRDIGSGIFLTVLIFNCHFHDLFHTFLTVFNF